MVFKLKHLYIIVIALTSIGCSFDEPIVFRGVKGVKVLGIRDGNVELEAIAKFSNPNEVSGKLKKVDIAVVMEEDTLARLTQKENLRIDKNSSFEVPIRVQLSLNDLQGGVLGNILSIIGGKKINLRFVGSIKVSSWGVTRKVPVDFESEVKL